MSTEQMITVKEAAELAGVSPTRIYQFIYEGRVEAKKEPPHKERGIWYIDRHSLERFRANQHDYDGEAA